MAPQFVILGCVWGFHFIMAAFLFKSFFFFGVVIFFQPVILNFGFSFFWLLKIEFLLMHIVLFILIFERFESFDLFDHLGLVVYFLHDLVELVLFRI